MRSQDSSSSSNDGSTAPDRRFSILDDVLGPVGHGPSSSHTVAPHLACREAQEMLGGRPDLAEVVLVNSMATTGDGHGTEVAVAAGLLGLRPTDADTTDALGLAEQVGLDLDFQRFPSLDDAHPNTIYLRLRRGELSLRVKIVSIGGGNYELDCGASAPVEGVSTPEQMHAW